MKCDETKPHCFQCRKRQLLCPGYQRQLRWTAKHEVLGVAPGHDAGRRPVSRTRIEATSDASASEALTPNTSRGILSPSSPQCSVSTPFRGYDSPTSAVDCQTTREAVIESLNQRAHTSSSAAAASRVDSVLFGRNQQVLKSTLVPPRIQQGTSFYSADRARPTRDLQWSRLDETVLRTISSECEVVGGQSCHIARISTGLMPQDDALLHHYFAEVCPLVSAFDSATNPFRYMISNLIDDSPLILNCVLSMSATWEIQRNESFLSKAVHCHSAAVGHLSKILIALRGRDASPEQECNTLSSSQDYEQIMQAILASILLGISSVSLGTISLPRTGSVHSIHSA